MNDIFSVLGQFRSLTFFLGSFQMGIQLLANTDVATCPVNLTNCQVHNCFLVAHTTCQLLFKEGLVHVLMSLRYH